MRSILLLVLALATASVSAVEVYRSVAPDGTVIYSDRPTDGATPVTVATSRTVAAAPQRPRASAPAASAAAALPEAADEAPSAAERAEERAQNCTAARERSERYSTAHRLYRTTENGEREYLNDGEIDEARARAAADVETWCS